MAVRQRGRKWMADLTVNGQRLPRYTFDTEEEAQAWEAEARAAVLNGRPVPAPSPARNAPAGGRVRTLREAWTRTHERHWRGTPSDAHMHLMGQRVCAYFGERLPVHRIDTEAVEGWVSTLVAQGRSGATINRYLAALSKVLKDCRAAGEIAVLPVLRRRKEAEGRLRWMEPEEERVLLALLRQWEKHDHAEVVTCLIDTGLRNGELFALTARDVKDGLIFVHKSKTDLPRSVPMTARVQAIVERRAKATAPGERLFPYDNFWLIRVWDRAKQAMGLANDEEFTPYVCRHTFASRLVQRGVGLRTIATLMGHKTIQMTMRYAKVAPTNLRDAVALLEQPAPVRDYVPGAADGQARPGTPVPQPA